MKDTAEINNARLFLHECTMLLDNKHMYSSLLDAIFDEFTHYLEDNFSSIVFDDKTLKLYKAFFQRLSEYIDSRPYGRNQVFVFLDIEWYNLRVEYLIPFIKSAVNDFETKKIHFDNLLKFRNLENKPSDAEILRQVNFLYSLIPQAKIDKYC